MDEEPVSIGRIADDEVVSNAHIVIDEPFSDDSRSAALTPGAEYGNLPFDRFVLGHWDYSRSLEQDQDQWNQLAKKWLSMTHIERNPYWLAGSLDGTPDPSEPWLPTEDQIQRVLAPHQTIHERNVSHKIATSIHDPLWVRTCFRADLAEAYNRIAEKALWQGIRMNNPALFLDEKSAYSNIGSDVGKILLRMPSIPDSVPYLGDPEYDYVPLELEQPEDESHLPLWHASLKNKSIIYLVDEEAVTEGLIKIIFFDLHGNVVWHNKIQPKHLPDFEGQAAYNGSLFEHFERWDGDAVVLQQPGALLDYD